MSLKIDIINGAHDQLRISGLTVEPTSRLIVKALSRLEKMMAMFAAKNVCVDYNFEEVPLTTSPTGVSLEHDLMMESNLAVYLVPDFGKQMPQVLLNTATVSYSTSAGISARESLNQVPYPSRQPIGSGNTYRYNNYKRYYRKSILPEDSCDAHTLAIGDVNDYAEPFRAYLKGDTIQSYTIEVTDGLVIVSDSNTDDVVYYRLLGQESTTTTTEQQVKIVMTSNDGRVETRIIRFTLIPLTIDA